MQWGTIQMTSQHFFLQKDQLFYNYLNIINEIYFREQFLPYMNNSFDLLSKLLEEDDEDTIESALEAYGQLCISLSKFTDGSGQDCEFNLFFIN